MPTVMEDLCTASSNALYSACLACSHTNQTPFCTETDPLDRERQTERTDGAAERHMTTDVETDKRTQERHGQLLDISTDGQTDGWTDGHNDCLADSLSD